MAKKTYVAPPVLMYSEILRVNKYLIWGVIRVPSFYMLFLLFKWIVISTDQKYFAPEMLYSAIAFAVWGIVLPNLIRKYKIHTDIYTDGIYMRINWFKEQDLGMKFKNLAFCATVRNPREFFRAGSKSKTAGKLRTLLTSGFRGVLLVNSSGDQFMVPSGNPMEMSKHISKK